MPIFSLDHGRLNPARSTIHADSVQAHEALIAVRDQVTEFLHQPFFPVAWLTEPPVAGQGDRHTSLVALEPSGQTVTIEVVSHLDAEVLMACLARAGRHNDMSRGKLSGLYPRGVPAFRRDWQEFLDSCPSLVDVGPRLIILCLDLSDDIRGAVDSLLGTGVQLFRISLIDSEGSVFVSLDEVRPHEASFRTIAQAASRVEIEGAPGVSDVPTANSPFDDDGEEEETGARAEQDTSPESASSAYEDEEMIGPVEAGEAVDAPEVDSPVEAGPFDHVFTSPVVAAGARGTTQPRDVSDQPAGDRGGDTEQAGPADTGGGEPAEQQGPADHRPTRDSGGGRFEETLDEDRLWQASRVSWSGGRVSMSDSPGEGQSDTPPPGAAETGRVGSAGQPATEQPAPGSEAQPEDPERAGGPGPVVDPDLVDIVRRKGEFTVTFRSLRRRVNAKALVTEQGIVFGEHTYPGPDEAAEAAMGRPGDGWRVWKDPQGVKLADLRDSR